MDVKMTFHSVGQGMFYTGNLPNFSFVFDCGSHPVETSGDWHQHIYESASQFRVDCASDTLDLLVISHFHEDHVNGMNILLNRFARVNVIVIPYISLLERLLIVLMQRRNISGDYLRFIFDPIGYLTSRINVARIIVLHDGDEEDTIPQTIELDTNGSLITDLPLLPRQTQTLHQSEMPSHPQVSVHSHHGNILFSSLWRFMFYYHRMSRSTLLVFERILSRHGILIQTKNDLIYHIRYSRRILRRCYFELANLLHINRDNSDINNTSLVMHHAPIRSTRMATRIREVPTRRLMNLIDNQRMQERTNYIQNHTLHGTRQFNRYQNSVRNYLATRRYLSDITNELMLTVCNQNRKTGTILFGDLNAALFLTSMQRHFGTVLNDTFVVALPHHGAQGNWNNQMLRVFSTGCCGHVIWVSSSGVSNTYGHPSREVLNEIENSIFHGNRVVRNSEVIQVELVSRVRW